MVTSIEIPYALDGSDLSIAVIGPDEQRRNTATSDLAGCQCGQIREFTSYPCGLDEMKQMLRRNFDVIFVDLDSDTEAALGVVESVRVNGPATVMVYSAKDDPDMLIRSMRAGAREFLTLPFSRGTMSDALLRASAFRPAIRPPKETNGRLLVFLGAKGGSGVTTLATSFAVSLAMDSGKSTLLIDLNLPLGDAAINLGIDAQYSTVDALKNSSKLDASFLSTLLTRHSSGLSVLAAPGQWEPIQIPNSAVDKLLDVARRKFDYVVVDAGSRLDLQDTDLLDKSATFFLITQVGIPELRNSNRLISLLSSHGSPTLKIVINRYGVASQGLAEERFTECLTRPVDWKIPNDYRAVKRMQNTATPLTLENSPISRMIQQMAISLRGQPETPAKKKKFPFFQ